MIWLALLIILVVVGGGWWGLPAAAILSGVPRVSDKPTALERIAQLMHQYAISISEVEAAMQATESSPPASARRSSGDIAKTLFAYLGAIFILSGIGTYIGTFWESMGGAMHVAVTLGVGYILLIVLVSALHEKRYPKLVLPLVLATAIMLTSGWFVLIHEVFPRGENWRLAVLAVFGVMAVHQAVLLRTFNFTVLAFTALFFLYGFLHVAFDMLGIPFAIIAIVLGASLFLVAAALEDTAFRALAEVALLIGALWLNTGLFDRIAVSSAPTWASVITGLCVMSTAYGLQRAGRYPRLAGLAYFAGSIAAYGGLFDLVRHTPVELLHLAVSAAMLYACVVLQSRALLFTTVIAMLSFIAYYSAQHFANSLGWPVTLVLMGIAFFGVSALAMKVRRHL